MNDGRDAKNGRRVYHAPKLIHLGSVREVTLAATFKGLIFPDATHRKRRS
jgi:hypothetical protein